MASGYNRRPLSLDLKRKEKRDPLDRPAALKVIMKDGVLLDSPQILTNVEDIRIANRLRQSAPKSEWVIWPALRALGFEHSVPMFGYFLDFYHPVLKICVEIDGAVHQHRKARDRHRDRKLYAAGITTHRFWARTVLAELDRVVAHITHSVELKSPLPSVDEKTA